MSLRRLAREIAFQVLYRHDLASPKTALGGTALEEDVERHFDHFQVEDTARAFARQLVLGALEKKADLDARIQALSSNWRLERMATVDRNLLRMAAYEILFVPDTPPAVVMDEAIELAKRFGNADSPKFINGVLDALAKARETPAPPPAETP